VWFSVVGEVVDAFGLVRQGCWWFREQTLQVFEEDKAVTWLDNFVGSGVWVCWSGGGAGGWWWLSRCD
jgi:hypothetical protein